MKLVHIIFAASLAVAGAASAQSGADQIQSQLEGYGYSDVTVTQTGTTFHVEGHRDGQVRSIAYDASGGHILKDDVHGEGERSTMEANDQAEGTGESRNDGRDNCDGTDSHDTGSSDNGGDAHNTGAAGESHDGHDNDGEGNDHKG